MSQFDISRAYSFQNEPTFGVTENVVKPDNMSDFYNAYHAVWRNRYENDI